MADTQNVTSALTSAHIEVSDEVSGEWLIKLDKSRDLFLSGAFLEAQTLIDDVIGRYPVDPEAHFIAGKICVELKEWDSALWHAFIAMACEKCSDTVSQDIIQKVHDRSNRETTQKMVHGVMAGFKGNLTEALVMFQEALVASSKREDKIRAYQFLCLTAMGMGKTEAAIKFCKSLLEFDSRSYIGRMWLADLYLDAKMYDEAKFANEEAQNLLLDVEAKGDSSGALSAEEVLSKSVSLRDLLEESTSSLLAPLRAFLHADPGKSNLWLVLRDELFGIDQIFGPSAPLKAACSLSNQVQDTVAKNLVKIRIKLELPMTNPLSENPEVAHYFEVEKVMASNARPALLQLYSKEGVALAPRLLWKAGDDLRQDMLAQILFEVFNLIWSATLGEGFERQITYKVLPLHGKVGFLEWVEDTETQERFDWQRADPELWMHTFATSMTAAFAIGAEDRHSRNILIKDGRKVFQIDFGYLFGIIPGMGFGAGPALPFSKHVSGALTNKQHAGFIAGATLLYDVLGLYKEEIACLADRFTKAMKLTTPVTINVHNFMVRQLGSTLMFRHKISAAERDVGRMRKEYIALAWGNKTFFPKDYSKFVDKSHTVVEAGVLEMIDPELLNKRVKKKSPIVVGMNKIGRVFKRSAHTLTAPGKVSIKPDLKRKDFSTNSKEEFSETQN